jgi:hypothetical protein
MTLRVEPRELRVFAAELADACRAVQAAKSYVRAQGTFSLHERGAIGVIFPGHSNYLDALDQMLTHLAALTEGSGQTMTRLAGEYEHSDLDAAARFDDSYPLYPRAPQSREAADRNVPLPPRNTF